MKMLNKLRKRGFTLIEITLVLAVGLGLIVGGLMFFQQAQASSEVTDKTRAIVSVSTEMRAQARTASNFTALIGEAAAPIADSAFGVRSGLPDATFNDIAIVAGANAQEFTIDVANLDEGVCERLAIADLGPKSVADATDCGAGTLSVTYTR